MDTRLMVIGGSAGGITALAELLGALPSDLDAALAVVVHRSSQGSGRLAEVLNRRSGLRVSTARHGQPLVRGHAYLAPPDRHLLINDGRVVLGRSAKVNRVRPAVDPLFQSAARWYGPAAIGVVLSGALDDGAVGLAAIDACGGTCFIQDPDEAMFPGMPESALAAVPAAKTLPVAALAAALIDLVDGPVAATVEPNGDLLRDLVRETDLAEQAEQPANPSGPETPGVPVPIGCPECRGAMRRIDLAGTSHYRCHVGHAYAPHTLIAAQAETAESALWTAVSVLEEQVAAHTAVALRSTEADRAAHEAAATRATAAVRAIRVTLTSDIGAAKGLPTDDLS